METSSGANPDTDSKSPSMGRGIRNSRRHAMQFPALNLLQAPARNLLEYSGIFTPRSDQPEREGLVAASDSGRLVRSTGDLSIRIIDGAEQGGVSFDESDEAIEQIIVGVVGQSLEHEGVDCGNGSGVRDRERDSIASAASAGGSDRTVAGGNGGRDSLYRRYDLQRVAGWVEQVVPFSLLLLVVFIRQHLQGFFIIIWITAVMFKSNDIVQKQTALKDERKTFALVGISTVFMLHTIGVYWWYWNDDLLYPLFMVPPKVVPHFGHAIFIILVNDKMVRQAAMALKCVLLMYYKNGRGHNFRQQGQMLTLVEYTLLLYRALLPAPVWYRFFLNKDYGSLFSSVTTGLYLTFKLASIIEKVQSVLDALKALSRKEVQYGFYATLEQVMVNAAGELCVICREKMHLPILLRCKHIFCEGCVSEWFERERTCPLCRALVRPPDVHSFGDGSTSLFFQLF